MAFVFRRSYRGQAKLAGQPAADPGVPEATPARSAGRTSVAAARGAWAVGTLMIAIARLVRVIVGVVVALIVVAILLRVGSANPANAIVRDLHDTARALIGPFKDVFSIKNPKVSIAVNWGLAAIAYLVIGGFVARTIVRGAPRGVGPPERLR
jgi:hypothetical protein